MKKQILCLLLVQNALFCMYENKPKTVRLLGALRNNITKFNIIPLGMVLWPAYKNDRITRDEFIKQYYKYFIAGIDKKEYALIYKKVNEEYLNKKNTYFCHPLDLFPREKEQNYWEMLADSLAELYAKTEVEENQSLDFLSE